MDRVVATEEEEETPPPPDDDDHPGRLEGPGDLVGDTLGATTDVGSDGLDTLGLLTGEVTTGAVVVTEAVVVE